MISLRFSISVFSFSEYIDEISFFLVALHQKPDKEWSGACLEVEPHSHRQIDFF